MVISNPVSLVFEVPIFQKSFNKYSSWLWSNFCRNFALFKLLSWIQCHLNTGIYFPTFSSVMILTKLDKTQMYRYILSNEYASSAKPSSLITLKFWSQKYAMQREDIDKEVIRDGNWMIDWALAWGVMRRWLVFGNEDFFCL